MQSKLELIALQNFPQIEPGDDLAPLITESLTGNNIVLRDGDVLVLAQKIVSKAEDRYVSLATVKPSQEALQLAAEVDKDPRLVQLILNESLEVVRKKPGVLIVEHRLGFVHANAGIDQSNIDQTTTQALLLPEFPDASAKALQQALEKSTGKCLSVLINDSAGRAWRNGTCGMCIGLAGFEPVNNLIGDHDMFGQELRVTTVAVADELAAAASFMMGQAGEQTPLVLIRGAVVTPCNSANSRSLVRDKSGDLFR